MRSEIVEWYFQPWDCDEAVTMLPACFSLTPRATARSEAHCERRQNQMLLAFLHSVMTLPVTKTFGCCCPAGLLTTAQDKGSLTRVVMPVVELSESIVAMSNPARGMMMRMLNGRFCAVSNLLISD